MFAIIRTGGKQYRVAADDVIAYAREHLANYKIPRSVEIVDALPTTATGKVLKTELRSRTRSGAHQQTEHS